MVAFSHLNNVAASSAFACTTSACREPGVRNAIAQVVRRLDAVQVHTNNRESICSMASPKA